MVVIKHLRVSENEKFNGHTLNASISGCLLSSQLSAARKLKMLQQKQEQKKKRQVLLIKIPEAETAK